MTTHDFVEVFTLDDLKDGEPHRAVVDKTAVAVVLAEGEVFAINDICSHGPGSLSEGFIDGETVECDFHSGSFNIKTGEVVEPPCMIPQKTYKTVVENDTVFIEV